MRTRELRKEASVFATSPHSRRPPIVTPYLVQIRFGIRFALHRAHGREERIGSQVMKAVNQLSILVVDDDEVLGRVLSRVLGQQGHAVQRAEGAAQALAL